MPRHNGGSTSTTHQKGHSRRGTGVGTYSRMKKRLAADRYTRPYLTGEYVKWPRFATN